VPKFEFLYRDRLYTQTAQNKKSVTGSEKRSKRSVVSELKSSLAPKTTATFGHIVGSTAHFVVGTTDCLNTPLKQQTTTTTTMMFPTAMTSLSLVLVLFCVSLAEPSSRLRRRTDSSSTVICRVMLEDTMFEAQANHRQTICNPVIDDKELDADSIIDLPDDLYQQHFREILRGTLWVSIEDASLDDWGQLVLGESPTYSVLDNVHRERQLLDLTGSNRTVAIVRISTQDSEHEDSVETIQEAIFESNVSFVTQMEQCSHGKVQLKQAEEGILDVYLPGTNADYNNDPYQLVNAATAQILQQVYHDNVSEMADRTIFCLPEGFGEWAARAAMNHWKISMNHGWCLSLSAAMRECFANRCFCCAVRPK